MVLVLSEYKGYVGRGVFLEANRALQENKPIQCIRTEHGKFYLIDVKYVTIYDGADWIIRYGKVVPTKTRKRGEKSMIKLGDQVKDMVSGMVGTAIQKTEYLNGCIQYGVQPKFKKGATEMPTWYIDQAQLVSLTKKKKVVVKRKRTGGPTLKIA